MNHKRDAGSGLTAERRSLPDRPGVYLFHDAAGCVIYVGKSVSIKKRVASHFSSPRGKAAEMIAAVDKIEFVVTEDEAHALITEQAFIQRHRPRFNVRMRDDKSYPYIGVSLDEEYPRVYFTRERHRRGRRYFGPYAEATRVRDTLEVLNKVFQYRTCVGPEPGRTPGRPCLDYFIKRCQAPCVGYVSPELYRENIARIIDFLSGRFSAIEGDLETQMAAAAAEQRYEEAAVARNRLHAVRRLLERRRLSESGIGMADIVAVAVDGVDANAQVFQIRDGVLAERQGFYLANEAGRDVVEVTEEFLMQFYGPSGAIPSQIVVSSEFRRRGAVAAIEAALCERRGGGVELKHAERGDKRRLSELAERNARLALEQERLRAERGKRGRREALEGLRAALGLDAPPIRIECYDISNLGASHTVASMVVFENGAAKKSDYRRFRLRDFEGQDDFAAIAAIAARRTAAYRRQLEISPHDRDYDASFAALPALVVIDGGKGQLTGALAELDDFRDQGVAVISLAKRLEEVFTPGARSPLVLAHDTPELQLLQRVRDEAHRFALAYHRLLRDRDLTTSIFDDLPGVGDARKRALLLHFGSPEAVVAAGRDQLEAVPGLPSKVGRDIFHHLQRAG